MNIDLTQIAISLIALLSAVVTGFFIPWLKSKIGINNDKLSDNQKALLKLAIETAVKAAEQLYYSEQGKEKKEYVLNVLKEQGFNIDGEAINAAIESIVFEVHKELTKENKEKEL